MERISVLERIRLLHEEVERRERSICEDWERPAKSYKHQLAQDHSVSHNIIKIHEASQDLSRFYADETKEKEKEVALLGSQRTNLFSVFYSRLKEIREYHFTVSEDPANYENPQDFRQVYNSLGDMDIFTGEEMQGKVMDLHSFHQRYINMPQFTKVDYLSFIKSAFKFDTVRRDAKNDAYHKYLDDLYEYLKGFLLRAAPLMVYSYDEKEFMDSFEKDLQEGRVAGWEPCSDNPLFCKACNKLFAKQSVFDGHLTGKKHLKAVADAGRGVVVVSGELTEKQKSIALLEARIGKYASLLQEKIEATISNVEKKQSQTLEELEKEREAEELLEQEDEEEDDDEVEKPFYNPLNLPLGWDGKPIPFWLYKLHGLSIEYKCQICGDETYFGPRNFERHFMEFTHINGLKSLGIPNLPHFRMVTDKEDAKELWKRIQAQMQTASWRPDVEEEFEDAYGNVFSKKQFEEARRQGLI